MSGIKEKLTTAKDATKRFFEKNSIKMLKPAVDMVADFIDNKKEGINKGVSGLFKGANIQPDEHRPLFVCYEKNNEVLSSILITKIMNINGEDFEVIVRRENMTFNEKTYSHVQTASVIVEVLRSLTKLKIDDNVVNELNEL